MVVAALDRRRRRQNQTATSNAGTRYIRKLQGLGADIRKIEHLPASLEQAL